MNEEAEEKKLKLFTEKQIYDELLRCKLTPEELKENGFPIGTDRPGYANCTINHDLKYNDKYQHIKKMTGNKRYCIRCSKMYEVNPKTWKQKIEGPETCSYHPGRKKSGGTSKLTFPRRAFPQCKLHFFQEETVRESTIVVTVPRRRVVHLMSDT